VSRVAVLERLREPEVRRLPDVVAAAAGELSAL